MHVLCNYSTVLSTWSIKMVAFACHFKAAEGHVLLAASHVFREQIMHSPSWTMFWFASRNLAIPDHQSLYCNASDHKYRNMLNVICKTGSVMSNKVLLTWADLQVMTITRQ